MSDLNSTSYLPAPGCIPVLGRARGAMAAGRISVADLGGLVEIMEGPRRNQAQLAAAMGVDKRTVQRMVARLRAAELIVTHQRAVRCTSVYVLRAAASRMTTPVSRHDDTSVAPLRPPLPQEDRFEASEVASHREEPKPPIDAQLEARCDQVIAVIVAAGVDPDCHRATLRKLVAANGDSAVEHAELWVAGLSTPVGRKAVPEPSFGAYCGKTLGPKLVRLGRDALERQRTAAVVVDPWVSKVAWCIVGSSRWDECNDGPKPGQPGCKAKFDVEAVVAHVEGILRDPRARHIIQEFAGREDRWAARFVAPVVGAEHASRLMGIVRQRAAEAA